MPNNVTGSPLFEILGDGVLAYLFLFAKAFVITVLVVGLIITLAHKRTSKLLKNLYFVCAIMLTVYIIVTELPFLNPVLLSDALTVVLMFVYFQPPAIALLVMFCILSYFASEDENIKVSSEMLEIDKINGKVLDVTQIDEGDELWDK